MCQSATARRRSPMWKYAFDLLEKPLRAQSVPHIFTFSPRRSVSPRSSAVAINSKRERIEWLINILSIWIKFIFCLNNSEMWCCSLFYSPPIQNYQTKLCRVKNSQKLIMCFALCVVLCHFSFYYISAAFRNCSSFMFFVFSKNLMFIEKLKRILLDWDNN